MPVLSDVGLGPDPSYEDSVLNCSLGQGTDIDGDNIAYSYQWFVNGVPVEEETTAAFSSEFFGGDMIRCQVTPADGEDEGAPVTGERLVNNSSPTISSVSISPTAPKADETLVCAWEGFSDSDGDEDQSEVVWTIDCHFFELRPFAEG